MATLEVRVPDLGTDDDVEVVEVLVSEGQEVAVEDGLITLESDKASMDVPSPAAGTITELKVKVGDKIKQGSIICVLDAAQEVAPATASADAAAPADPPAPAGSDKEPFPAPAAAAKPSFEPFPEPGGRESSPADDRSNYDTQLVVIGAGPGGYTAAFRAADLGLDVTLIERYPTLGGVCLNVGCIPSKALLHVASVIQEADALGEHGVSFGQPDLDLDRLRSWKDGVVGRLTAGLTGLAKRRKVRVIQGSARLSGAHTLEIATDSGTETLTFGQAIIAAGSRVVEIPGVSIDDPRVMDSTGALALDDVPERLLLVGGGIIGLEMAMVYGALGSRLTIVELLDGLVPECDRDLVKPLEERLRQTMGAEIYLGTKVMSIEAGEDLTARLEGPEAPDSAVFDRALIAVGRRPNGDRLALESAGVVSDERGFVPVDRSQRTNQPHIYAIGDIVGQPMLAHKATHQGKVAAETAAGEKSSFDARAIPSVAYTDPEIAWVGLTETAAEENGTRYEKAVFPWAASGRALGIGRSEGLTKLLFDPQSRRLLGAGIVGPHAGDLIAELALAIEMDCEAGDLALTIHPHPTLSETVNFAAETFEGTITDLYLPRKR